MPHRWRPHVPFCGSRRRLSPSARVLASRVPSPQVIGCDSVRYVGVAFFLVRYDWCSPGMSAPAGWRPRTCQVQRTRCPAAAATVWSCSAGRRRQDCEGRTPPRADVRLADPGDLFPGTAAPRCGRSSRSPPSRLLSTRYHDARHPKPPPTGRPSTYSCAVPGGGVGGTTWSKRPSFSS